MQSDGIAQQLIDGLTAGQLAGLMARLLDRMSDTDRAEFGNTLDPDVAAVFRHLWDPPAAGASTEETSGRSSDAKFEAKFQSVLGSLQGLLPELGDEEGDYVLRENDWEPLYFNASRLTGDIERCAKNLLPLLERAAALGLEDESLFMELCREITDGVGQYPEHIYTEEGVSFGCTATECVLKWLDLHAETETGFLEKLVAVLDGTGCVTLDDDTIRAYVLDGWPEARRGAFYRAIEDRRARDDEFRRKTDKPRTLWHGLRYALAGVFDVAAGIEIAEASVGDDWTKGVELVDAALADGNSARALAFCGKTVDSYYPTLRAMLSQHCRLSQCPARREWLRRTDVAGLTAGGLGFVQRNMARLIPSPMTMGGDYETAAGWLAAAREVAPGIALSTLQRWRIDHKRRRNLWRELSKRGFAVA